MKWLKYGVGILLILLVILVVVASLFLGTIIKTGVETAGPKIMGVPVTLEAAKVSPLRGTASLKGLEVGNPEGYKTEHLFKMNQLAMQLDVKSVASDQVVIKSIYIDAPEITFEGSLKGSNISALMKQLESPESGSEGDEGDQEAAPESKAGKKIIIEDFLLEHAKLKLSMGVLGGHAVTVPMPPIHLTDIGKDEGGASPAQVTKEVFAAVYKGVLGAVKSSGALIGKGAELAVDGAGKAAGLAVDGAKATGEALGEGAGAAAGVAGDAAKKTGEAVGKGAEVATDAAKKTGEAIGAGAKKLTKGIGGLLGKDE